MISSERWATSVGASKSQKSSARNNGWSDSGRRVRDKLTPVGIYWALPLSQVLIFRDKCHKITPELKRMYCSTWATCSWDRTCDVEGDWSCISACARDFLGWRCIWGKCAVKRNAIHHTRYNFVIVSGVEFLNDLLKVVSQFEKVSIIPGAEVVGVGKRRLLCHSYDANCNRGTECFFEVHFFVREVW